MTKLLQTFPSTSSGRGALARVTLIISLFLPLSASFATTVDLPPPVARALKDAGIAAQNAAIVVQGVDDAQPLLRINARRPMNPASTMKLLTTYAALELLGPAYTWKTEVLTDATEAADAHSGSPATATLDGNVYLRGSGDPRLALEQFWLLLRQLRARGVAAINGDLVLDRSAFSLPAHDPAAFDNQPLRPYNAGPDALLINLNSVRLLLRGDAPQKTVSAVGETPNDHLQIDNHLQLTDDACGDWRERLKVSVAAERIVLAGTFSAQCGEKALNLSPWSPDVQVDGLFRALWRELGGSLRGSVRAAPTPAGARLLCTQESPPLADVVREINKYSNNVMARQVLLSLAESRPATNEAATQRVHAWLAAKSLSIPELVLDNGSGLSRSERITADGLARLLLAAWQSPVMPELMSSLPLAGVDGTLSKRLGNGAVAGRAHLKTGFLENVRAIAGYVQDSRDKRWVVVVLINDAKARQGKPAIDALLEWVAEH